MQGLIDQLQGKVKAYKKQIEEAEEIAAMNLAKYRKVAGALGDAEAVADANEQVCAGLDKIITSFSISSSNRQCCQLFAELFGQSRRKIRPLKKKNLVPQ